MAKQRRRAVPRWNPGDPDARHAALKESAVWLRDNGFPFALIGGAALQAHGYIRATDDIDWMTWPGLDGALEDSLVGESGATARIMRHLPFGGIRTELFGFTVDVLSRHDDLAPLFADALRSALRDPMMRVGGTSVHVVGVEYLVAMKMSTPRSKDKADAIELLWRAPVDRPRLKRILSKYGRPGWEALLPFLEEEALSRAEEDR